MPSPVTLFMLLLAVAVAALYLAARRQQRRGDYRPTDADVPDAAGTAARESHGNGAKNDARRIRRQ
jgi:hypothetical protein